MSEWLLRMMQRGTAQANFIFYCIQRLKFFISNIFGRKICLIRSKDLVLYHFKLSATEPSAHHRLHLVLLSSKAPTKSSPMPAKSKTITSCPGIFNLSVYWYQTIKAMDWNKARLQLNHPPVRAPAFYHRHKRAGTRETNASKNWFRSWYLLNISVNFDTKIKWIPQGANCIIPRARFLTRGQSEQKQKN